MTFDELQQLAAHMRQHLGVDAEATQLGEQVYEPLDQGGALQSSNLFDAIWIGTNRTYFLWTQDGKYAGVQHGYGPTRKELVEPTVGTTQPAPWLA